MPRDVHQRGEAQMRLEAQLFAEAAMPGLEILERRQRRAGLVVAEAAQRAEVTVAAEGREIGRGEQLRHQRGTPIWMMRSPALTIGKVAMRTIGPAIGALISSTSSPKILVIAAITWPSATLSLSATLRWTSPARFARVTFIERITICRPIFPTAPGSMP